MPQIQIVARGNRRFLDVDVSGLLVCPILGMEEDKMTSHHNILHKKFWPLFDSREGIMKDVIVEGLLKILVVNFRHRDNHDHPHMNYLKKQFSSLKCSPL